MKSSDTRGHKDVVGLATWDKGSTAFRAAWVVVTTDEEGRTKAVKVTTDLSRHPSSLCSSIIDETVSVLFWSPTDSEPPRFYQVAEAYGIYTGTLLHVVAKDDT